MRVNLFNRWHSNNNTSNEHRTTTKAQRNGNKKSKRKFPLESSLSLSLFLGPGLFLFHFGAFAFDAKLVCCSWVRLPLVNFYFRFIQICNFVFYSLAIAILLLLLLVARGDASRQQLFLDEINRKNPSDERSQVWIWSARR